MDRDRNLLFGVFAVQLRKVNPNQLMAAAGAWAADNSKDLPDRLIQDGVLSTRDRDFIARLVEEAVRAHDGDAEATLNNLGGQEQVSLTFAGSIRLTDRGTIEPVLIPPEALISLDERQEPGVIEVPGRYTRQTEYARGGMGRVLLVHDEYIGRDVALKELLPGSKTPPDNESTMRRMGHVIGRFLQEARITAQLEHPAIVPVYELGRRTDGSVYYTMKLVRGKTLAKALSECRNLADRLMLLPHFVDLCQAIAYSHSRRIIHRDIKPGNVMVGEFGETVVLDWGLAKAIDAEDVHAEDLAETLITMRMGGAKNVVKTLQGAVLGTPSYMAPEQARGEIDRLNESSDVYSLGAVLYELVAGALPFSGRNVGDILDKVITAEPFDVLVHEKHAPPELSAICRRAMSKDPANRYKDAGEMVEDLQRFETGALVTAYEYNLKEHLHRLVARHRGAFASALLVFVIVLTALAGYVAILNRSNIRLELARFAAEKSAKLEENARRAAEEARQREENWRTQYFRGVAERADQGLRELVDKLSPYQNVLDNIRPSVVVDATANPTLPAERQFVEELPAAIRRAFERFSGEERNADSKEQPQAAAIRFARPIIDEFNYDVRVKFIQFGEALIVHAMMIHLDTAEIISQYDLQWDAAQANAAEEAGTSLVYELMARWIPPQVEDRLKVQEQIRQSSREVLALGSRDSGPSLATFCVFDADVADKTFLRAEVETAFLAAERFLILKRNYLNLHDTLGSPQVIEAAIRSGERYGMAVVAAIQVTTPYIELTRLYPELSMLDSVANVTMSLVDIESAKVVTCVSSACVNDSTSLNEKIKKLVQELMDRYPRVEGEVTDVDGERVVVDFGSDSGIKENMWVQFYSENESLGILLPEIALRRATAVGRIIETSSSEAVCKVVQGTDDEPSGGLLTRGMYCRTW